MTELRKYGITEIRNYGNTEIRNYGIMELWNKEIRRKSMTKIAKQLTEHIGNTPRRADA